MSNPWRGEVELDINGEARVMRLTLGALAELEAQLGETTIVDLVARFETGKTSAQDVMALIVAGLRGGGWNVTAEDLVSAEIAGGITGAAKAAAKLLARAFVVPGAAA
ncbi:gene transfer agent family protein [Primorskyibacter sp. S187A]|uniref:gene transfer agent family protein n=1 Tax=Primorskyibacter sp. S187A TaxID=3415130 RepID=UPI003C7E9DBC